MARKCNYLVFGLSTGEYVTVTSVTCDDDSFPFYRELSNFVAPVSQVL